MEDSHKHKQVEPNAKNNYTINTYSKAYGHAGHMWHNRDILWKIERTIRNRGMRPNRRLRWNEALCIRIEFKFLRTNLIRAKNTP
jgi:hypothetical protein